MMAKQTRCSSIIATRGRAKGILVAAAVLLTTTLPLPAQASGRAAEIDNSLLKEDLAITETATPTPRPTLTPTPCPTGTTPPCPSGNFTVCVGGPGVCTRRCTCEACEPCPDGQVFAPWWSPFCQCVELTPTLTPSPTITLTPSGIPTAPTSTPTDTATPTVVPCVGDCIADARVTVDELIRCVNIALGAQSVGDCPACDANRDGEVRIDELLRGVNAALDGCPVTAP